jgi:hypothetical protein
MLDLYQVKAPIKAPHDFLAGNYSPSQYFNPVLIGKSALIVQKISFRLSSRAKQEAEAVTKLSFHPSLAD